MRNDLIDTVRQIGYWRRFWREFNWDLNYQIVRDRTARMLSFKAPIVPKTIIIGQAHMLLEAHYRGRWRMVWGVFRKAVRVHYQERYWPFVEWFRTKVLRRPQNEAVAAAERVWEEESLNSLARQL